jgi:Holliday junction resolvasome RuvABC endonuclease subunit
MILGLDCSTVVCGWCILDNYGKFLSVGHIKFNKSNNLYDKLRFFRSVIRLAIVENLIKGGDIDKIFIEEPAKMFSSASTAHIMSLLQRFNGMICAAISIDLAKDPELISCSTARKLVGVSLPKKAKKKDTKNAIYRHIKQLNIIPNETWEYKKTGTLKDHCFDICDAYVVARGGFLRGST